MKRQYTQLMFSVKTLLIWTELTYQILKRCSSLMKYEGLSADDLPDSCLPMIYSVPHRKILSTMSTSHKWPQPPLFLRSFFTCRQTRKIKETKAIPHPLNSPKTLSQFPSVIWNPYYMVNI